MSKQSTGKHYPNLTKNQRSDLLDLIDKNLKANGHRNSMKTAKYVGDEYIEWDNLELTVELASFTIDELKAEFNQIRSSCRLYRTYSEMYEDLKKSAFDVAIQTRPINAYARFVRQRCTDGTHFSECAKEWKTLPESEKQVFLDEAAKELHEWKITNKGQEGVAIIKEAKYTKGPRIPLKPIELFCHKFKDDVDGENDIEELRNKFFKLKRGKQLSYIKASMKCLQEYRAKVKDYLEENPDYVDKCKYKQARYPLSIREFHMWTENYLDAPARPQNSAKEQYAHDEDLTMLEASDYWKTLPRKQKNTKNIIFKDKQRKYDSDYAAWYEKQDDFVQEELARCGFEPKKGEIDSNDSELDTNEDEIPVKKAIVSGKRAIVRSKSPEKVFKSKAVVEESESEEEENVEEKVEEEILESEEEAPSPPKKKKKSKDGKKKKKDKKKKEKKKDSSDDE